MPSSGYPMEDFEVDPDNICYIREIEENAKAAIMQGLFTEWLECFIGAYNHIRRTKPKTAKWRAAHTASEAGREEWDF